jgi:hypothetical protein
MVYHVLNRGNGRMRLFHKAGDYEAFERVLAEGLERYPVDLLTYCVMPPFLELSPFLEHFLLSRTAASTLFPPLFPSSRCPRVRCCDRSDS